MINSLVESAAFGHHVVKITPTNHHTRYRVYYAWEFPHFIVVVHPIMPINEVFGVRCAIENGNRLERRLPDSAHVPSCRHQPVCDDIDRNRISLTLWSSVSVCQSLPNNLSCTNSVYLYTILSSGFLATYFSQLNVARRQKSALKN